MKKLFNGRKMLIRRNQSNVGSLTVYTFSPAEGVEFKVRTTLQNGEPWFVAKDIADVLGYADTDQAIRVHCKGAVESPAPFKTAGGPQKLKIIPERDVYRLIMRSKKQEAEVFEEWVVGEVLPSIRKTGSYAMPSATPEVKPLAPAEENFQCFHRIARLVGLDLNAASISANNATRELTGTDFLKLLNYTHLPAENQEHLFFTPTELGKRLGISNQAMNKLLKDAGLQLKPGKNWVPTEQAAGLFRILDTGKKHSNGTMVQQVKWSDEVLNSIHREE